MKIAYRPRAIDIPHSEEPDNYIVDNGAGMKIRVTKSRCIRLGFTADEIDCAETAWLSDDMAFVVCPRPAGWCVVSVDKDA